MTHVFEKRYELITYPDGENWAEGWGGFAARILVNPSGAELRHEKALWAEYQKRNTEGEFIGTFDAEDEYWRYVAPRIPEWNLVIRDEDGEREIPPPAVDHTSIYELEPSVIGWLALVVHAAHIPKVRAAMQGQTPTASKTDAGTTGTTPPTNLSLLNSPPPAATSSTA